MDIVSQSLDHLLIERAFVSRWQIFTIFFCCMSTLHTSMFVFLPTFYRVHVPYQCTDENLVVTLQVTNCSYDEDITCEEDLQNFCPKNCEKWHFDYSKIDISSSITENFLLICDREILLEIHGSLYFVGLIFGSAIGGFLSDSFGRAKWMRVSYFVAIVFSVLMAVVDSLPVHFLCWSVVSGTNVSAWVSSFALTAESGKIQTRHLAGILYGIAFGLGVVLIAVTALFIPNWRHLILATSFVALLDFLVAFLLDESPRWLWNKRRYKEVYEIAEKAAKLAKTEMPEDTKKELKRLCALDETNSRGNKSIVDRIKSSFSIKAERSKEESKTDQVSFFTMFKYHRLTVRFFLLSVHWVCINTLYYGMSLGAEMFNQPLHIFAILQGIASIIGSVLGVALLRVLGRKTLKISMLITTSVCFFLCVLMPKSFHTLVLVVTFIGKVCLELCFLLCYLWTSEVMPTIIRSSAIGLASLLARCTGMGVPFIGNLARIWAPLPLLFYGCFALLVVLCSVMLPETRNKPLSNTLEEGNLFGTKYQVVQTKLDLELGGHNEADQQPKENETPWSK